MKFFWKLYLSIMLITVTFFSIGGYFLIQSSFHTSLEREIESIYKENDIYISSLQREFNIPMTDTHDTTLAVKILQNSIGTITIQTLSGNLSFCLRDAQGQIIYQNGGFSDKNNFINKIDDNQRGYKIFKEKNQYTLHALRPFQFGNIDIYIQNSRNISSLFQTRNEQYQIFITYTILLSCISAIIIYIIARWLMKPLHKLSLATKEIANGDFIEDIPVSSEDEIGQFTKDFNTMSTRLKTSIASLQDSVERQEIFVSNFAHELKTPLTSMIGYGDMIRSKTLTTEQIVTYAHAIVQEGKRLESMSMKLMDLIVLKKQDFIMHHISAQVFFEIVKETFTPITNQENINFTMDIEESYLWIEPDLMQTVFFNLLDNARKAITTDGQISIIGRNTLQDYEVKIIDNGCGINSQNLNKVREAFYMVDKSRSRNAGSAGLGLAITDQIIQLHHATMTIDSTLYIGTTITIHLKKGENIEKI